MIPDRVVIVGAGLAGSRCAQTLRAGGFEGEVTLIGEEPHPPYERPALSKEFLSGLKDEIALQEPGYWEDNDIRVLLSTRVERVDLAARRARTARADIDWDALVLATGARPRRLPGLHGPGVHVLRTRSHAVALQEELHAGGRLVVVGAGFVGAEVASTARTLGLEVMLVDAERLPFERTLGPDVGRFLAGRYRAHGVDLRLGTRVERLWRKGCGAPRSVVLADGSEHPCDLVLVAVGAEPAGELIGLPAGVPTDETGRTALPDVYACGDVAVPWLPAAGSHVRLEHWASAAHYAAAVAHTLLEHEPQTAPSPFFWSDQFGCRLQHVGAAAGWAGVVVEGDDTSLEAHYVDAEGSLLAALLLNRPGAVPGIRRRLTSERLAA